MDSGLNLYLMKIHFTNIYAYMFIYTYKIYLNMYMPVYMCKCTQIKLKFR